MKIYHGEFRVCYSSVTLLYMGANFSGTALAKANLIDVIQTWE
ncbi:MAG: hypothetical protein SGI74_01960 [Oligoflexia bacterium]|nr:hypothetical protein [Oligoflexia bacterium]